MVSSVILQETENVVQNLLLGGNLRRNFNLLVADVYRCIQKQFKAYSSRRLLVKLRF